MSNLVSATSISVDCVYNDSTNIRYGGPQFLGFDFNVREENIDEMIKFISMTLKTFNVPLISIHYNEIVLMPKENICSKDKIVECIKNDAPYLIEQAINGDNLLIR